jgi:ADP-ribosyl-[dinitrogen reductase] hydrolase
MGAWKCAGDALAAPTHWYYDRSALDRDFPDVSNFLPCPERHPSSIMAVSSTGGAGRGSTAGDVVGRVILHGKKEFWGKSGVHYHRGLKAGDNTLNAVCARVLLRSVVKEGALAEDAWLRDYVAFMTTPDSHTDTYAESYHRLFFANYARGVPPRECGGDDGHNIASMGAMVTVPIAVLAVREAGDASWEDRAAKRAAEHIMLTHRNKELQRYVQAYARALVRVLRGSHSLRAAALDGAASVGRPLSDALFALPDRDVIGGRVFSHACYIDDSLPALFYLAAKYADDPEAALIASVRVGGENVHRSAALGALLGAAHGFASLPARWTAGLLHGDQVRDEVAGLLRVLRLAPDRELPASGGGGGHADAPREGEL